MKKIVFTVLILPLFASAAEAGPVERYHLGDAATSGCVVGAALGAMMGAADSIAEHKPTLKLATMPGLGCVVFGTAAGFGTGAMAAEAPPQDELQAELPPASDE